MHSGSAFVEPISNTTLMGIRDAQPAALRTRNRLMHDGLSVTREEAILRHAGQAASVIQAYRALSPNDEQALVAFLNSL
jgi:CxxC motif-containing protein (DUF1111 family)